MRKSLKEQECNKILAWILRTFFNHQVQISCQSHATKIVQNFATKHNLSFNQITKCYSVEALQLEGNNTITPGRDMCP